MVFRRARRPVVERTAAGFVLNLADEELDLLVRLMDELRNLLLADDPATAPLLRRLFPPAYHLADDAEAEAEYQRLMREELVASRLAALNAVQQALAQRAPLDDEGIHGLVQSLNSVRLVLGTLLDVGEDHDPSEVGDDDPMVGEHHLYTFLSWLLDAAVGAISRGA
jgi:hypothetical protein